MTDEERSKFYLSVQNFLKTSPLGISYSGPTNGELNSSMLSALQSLESLLSSKFGENFNGTIVRGSIISSSGFQKAIQKLSLSKEEKIKEKKDEKEDVTSDLNLEFQKFFSSAHDFFPKLYSGPQDGKINPALVLAAQKAEDILVAAVGEPKIKNKIFNAIKQKFLTSTSDLLSAINLISKNKMLSGNIES